MRGARQRRAPFLLRPLFSEGVPILFVKGKRDRRAPALRVAVTGFDPIARRGSLRPVQTSKPASISFKVFIRSSSNLHKFWVCWSVLEPVSVAILF